MRLVITSTNPDIEYFIRSYLTDKIKNLFIISVDSNKLEKYDKILGISSYDVLLYYISHLSISRVGDDRFIIKPNDYTNIRGNPIGYYIKFITYGSLNVGGYKILLKIFKHIEENIDDIYEDYLSEY